MANPLLTPELLRQLEQFQLLAARRANTGAFRGPFRSRFDVGCSMLDVSRLWSEPRSRTGFVSTPAFTPTLSPRRGRILPRVSSRRTSPVIRPFSPANNQPTAIAKAIFKLPARGRPPFPLLGGEGQGEGGRQTNFKAKATSNTEHRTPNTEPSRTPARSMFNVQCSMFDVSPS
jgi:hypothetical protein